MTENTPSAPPVPTPPAADPAKETKQPPWGSDENFDPQKAWDLIQSLRKEKGDPNLRTELEQLRTSQQAQRDALAAALGVKPEETSDSDKLAQEINALKAQMVATERRAIALETKVPENLLTAGTPDEMRAQAQQLTEFAQAAHYAAITAQPTPPPPAFQANPGQGQGNAPMTPEAQAAAEYEKYYPSAS